MIFSSVLLPGVFPWRSKSLWFYTSFR